MSEENLKACEKDDIEILLSMMNDGHLFRKYVEKHLAKDFLFDLMKGIRNTRQPPESKKIEEALEEVETYKEMLKAGSGMIPIKIVVEDLNKLKSILEGK